MQNACLYLPELPDTKQKHCPGTTLQISFALLFLKYFSEPSHTQLCHGPGVLQVITGSRGALAELPNILTEKPWVGGLAGQSSLAEGRARN